jgi:putative transposase
MRAAFCRDCLTLEQLDLLLLTVSRPRKIHPDGIHFQGLRYLDQTLAAYVGEAVVIRYDPRDLAEIRVFYEDRFLARPLCAELAGRTLALKDLTAARNARRRELRRGIRERDSIVDHLLAVHAPDFDAHPPADGDPAANADPGPRLKRYREE